jgi:hypothetical protein
MKQSFACTIGLAAFCISCLVWRTSVAAEIDMEVLNYPARVSRFSEFYVRVKIRNNGKIPLQRCDGLEEKCIAVGWDFVDKRSVSGLPISLPRDNIVPVLPYSGSYLSPGQAIDKSIRVPTVALGGHDQEAVLSLYLIVKEGSSFRLQEKRLTMAVKDAPLHIKRRRDMVRTMVYGYLGLSLTALWFFLYGRKGRSR